MGSCDSGGRGGELSRGLREGEVSPSKLLVALFIREVYSVGPSGVETRAKLQQHQIGQDRLVAPQTLLLIYKLITSNEPSSFLELRKTIENPAHKVRPEVLRKWIRVISNLDPGNSYFLNELVNSLITMESSQTVILKKKILKNSPFGKFLLSVYLNVRRMSYPQVHFLYQRLTSFIQIQRKQRDGHGHHDGGTPAKSPEKKGDKDKSQRMLKGLDLFQKFTQTTGKSSAPSYGMDYFEGYITEYRKMQGTISPQELLEFSSKQKEKQLRSEEAKERVKDLRSLWKSSGGGSSELTLTVGPSSSKKGVLVVTPSTEKMEEGESPSPPMLTRAKTRRSNSLIRHMYLESPKQLPSIPQSPRKTRSNKSSWVNTGSLVLYYEEDECFYPSEEDEDETKIHHNPQLLEHHKPINTSTPKSPRGKRKGPLSNLLVTPIFIDMKDTPPTPPVQNKITEPPPPTELKDGWELVRSWSRKQIERVIKDLMERLFCANVSVPSPMEISQFVQTIKRNPSAQVLLPQLHFLEYLNGLRIKDVVKCTDALRTSFDIRIKPNSSELSKGTPYAAYNFALFYNQLGYKEDAMSSLEEAFRAGHAAGDSVCLHHCHNLWSSLHGRAYTDAIIPLSKQQDAPSMHLHSINVFAHAFDLHYQGAASVQVLNTLWHYNADCDLEEMEANLLTSLSTFFTMFGWHEMISFPCQMILNTGWKWNTRWYSYALCCLSQCLLFHGDISLPSELMLYGHQIFGHDASPAGQLFQEQHAIFKALLEYLAYRPVPDEIVATISSFSQEEAWYWQAYNLMIQCDWEQAAEKLNKLYLKLVDSQTQTQAYDVNDLIMRVLLMQAEIECLCGNCPGALIYLTEGLELATRIHSDLYITLCHAHIASIQCELNLVKTGALTLEKELRSIIRSSSPWLEARLNVLQVRIRLRLEVSVGKTECSELAGKLSKAQELYEKYGNNYRLKEIFHLKGELYDSSTELGENGSKFRKIGNSLHSHLPWAPGTCLL